MLLTVVGDVTVESGNVVLMGDLTAIGDGTASNKFGKGYTIEAENIAVSNGASINADMQGSGVMPGRARA